MVCLADRRRCQRKPLQHPSDSARDGRRFDVCAGEQCYFTLRSLLILCPSYLLFMVANGGLALPGGLFMPSIMVRPAPSLCPICRAVSCDLVFPQCCRKARCRRIAQPSPTALLQTRAGLSHSC